MAISPVDLAWSAAFVLAYLLVAVVAVLASIGIPAFVGKAVYDRARTEELSNPAGIGLAAAFFTVLVGLFSIGVLLVYVG